MADYLRAFWPGSESGIIGDRTALHDHAVCALLIRADFPLKIDQRPTLNTDFICIDDPRAGPSGRDASQPRTDADREHEVAISAFETVYLGLKLSEGIGGL